MFYYIVGIVVGIILIFNSVNTILKKKTNLENIVFLICGVLVFGISIIGFFVDESWELTIYIGLLLFTFIPILLYLVKNPKTSNKRKK